jgi:hypothetical protein
MARRIRASLLDLKRSPARLGHRWRRLGWRRRVGIVLLALVVLIWAGLVYREWTTWPVRVALRQPGDSRPLAFSPDGRTLATAGSQTGITVWDLAEGRVRAIWPVSTAGHVVAGQFAPDGRTYAVRWLAQDAKRMPDFGFDLLDVATGRVRATIPSRPGFCYSSRLTDSGILRLVMGGKGAVEIIDHEAVTGSVIARRAFSYPYDSKWFPVAEDAPMMALGLFPPGAHRVRGSRRIRPRRRLSGDHGRDVHLGA